MSCEENTIRYSFVTAEDRMYELRDWIRRSGYSDLASLARAWYEDRDEDAFHHLRQVNYNLDSLDYPTTRLALPGQVVQGAPNFTALSASEVVDEAPKDIQVEPIDDLVDHEASRECICGPRIDERPGDAAEVVHYPLDGRDIIG